MGDASYTVDVFSSLDGFGSATEDWGGYWGKQGPELLERREELYSGEVRSVLGAHTIGMFIDMRANAGPEHDSRDRWVTAMVSQPTIVPSRSITEPLDWPDATVIAGDAVDVVPELKKDSEVPLRSHGSLAMNRSLMSAGLVDFLHVTVFPVITGRTGSAPLFAGYEDFDLELVSSRTFDGRTQELIYAPTRH